MKLSLTAYLVIALALSGAATVFLGWRLAASGQRCETEKAQAERNAVIAERDRAAAEEKKAAAIADETKSEARAASAASQVSTNARETAIRNVSVRGDCRMPAGLPSLQPAVDEANAAGRD